MSTKSPSSKPKRKRTKEESKHETVAPVHKSNVKTDNNQSESPIPPDYEENAESNRTYIYEDKNENVATISRDISLDTGLQINCKIENGIIGFMEQEIKKEKSKYSHFTDSRPQSLSFYEEEKAPEELSGQLEQLSPEEKRVLKRRRDDRKIDIELDASTYKEIQNVLNREKEEVLLAGIMKSQKSKSRKKKQFDSEENIPGIGDSREHMIPNGKKKSKKSKKRESSPLPGTSHSKKKHRKRDEHEPRNDITVALDDLQDDVFEKDSGDVTQGDTQQRMPAKSNTVYVQKKSGFQATPRDRLFSSIELTKEDYNKRFSDMVPLDLAMYAQRYWLPISVLCNGLLAGLALTHIIVTQSNVMDEEFINQYKTYAEAYSTLFFFFCVISTISVFDRYDIKHLHCVSEMISNKKSGLCIALYIAALLVHLANVKHDDHITLYNYINDDNANSTFELMTPEDMQQWSKLSFWRSILAIFGWAFVALGSADDMLHIHLQSMERFIQNPA